jgi:hypothetical protein
MRRRSQEPRKHVGAFSRCLVLAVAWLALVGQASSFVHVLLVRHTVCLEHGEITHPDEQTEASSASSTGTAQQTESKTAAIRAGAQAELEHGHNHCAIALHRRERLALIACMVVIADDCAEESPSARVETAEHEATVAVFRYAPKSSPPA